MSDDKVVDFAAAKQRRLDTQGPHTEGPCVCLGCKHEWIGVIPCGTSVVDCPACTTQKGVRAGLMFVSVPHWTCDLCDNDYLHVIKTGVYCPLCGSTWNWDQISETFSE